MDVRRTPRDNVLDLEYVIVEQEPARISRILITGNTRTKERVIRRELRAAPGDLFKRSRVIRSQREVFQLGFFNDIQMDSRSADRETGAIDLLLHVEERQTGTASLGAGVNSQAGLTGFLQLSQNNFMGKEPRLGTRKSSAYSDVSPLPATTAGSNSLNPSSPTSSIKSRAAGI